MIHRFINDCLATTFFFTATTAIGCSGTGGPEAPAPVDQVAQGVEISTEVFINDPLYGEQAWNYETAHITDAWNLTMGSDVRVAVIDTGSAAHPDLAWGVGHNFVTPNFMVPQDPEDPTSRGKYHGLHVAGIIAATANNGTGGLGVCSGCTLIPVRVSASLHKNVPDVDLNGIRELGEAILWAAGADLPSGARRADVINLSMNTDTRHCSDADQGIRHEMQDLRDAFQLAFDRNVTIVVSAGNFGSISSSSVRFPADCPHAIAVAATEHTLNALAPYSDRGIGVTVVAPGGGFNNPPPLTISTSTRSTGEPMSVRRSAITSRVSTRIPSRVPTGWFRRSPPRRRLGRRRSAIAMFRERRWPRLTSPASSA
jgi:subtilisin family serine protease